MNGDRSLQIRSHSLPSPSPPALLVVGDFGRLCYTYDDVQHLNSAAGGLPLAGSVAREQREACGLCLASSARVRGLIIVVVLVKDDHLRKGT